MDISNIRLQVNDERKDNFIAMASMAAMQGSIARGCGRSPAAAQVCVDWAYLLWDAIEKAKNGDSSTR